MTEYKERLKAIHEKMMYEDEFDFTPYEIKYDPEDSKKKEIVYDEKEVQELGKILRVNLIVNNISYQKVVSDMKKISSQDQQNSIREFKKIFSEHAPLLDYDKKEKLAVGVAGMKSQNGGLEYYEVFSRIVKGYKTFTDKEESN